MGEEDGRQARCPAEMANAKASIKMEPLDNERGLAGKEGTKGGGGLAKVFGVVKVGSSVEHCQLGQTRKSTTRQPPLSTFCSFYPFLDIASTITMSIRCTGPVM